MINVSETAAEKINELLSEENKAGSGLRVFVQGGGCSGFQYGLMIEENGQGSGDAVFESHGVKLFVDPISVRYLKGAEVDFVETITGGGFTIKNPQATSTCGSRGGSPRLPCRACWGGDAQTSGQRRRQAVRAVPARGGPRGMLPRGRRCPGAVPPGARVTRTRVRRPTSKAATVVIGLVSDSSDPALLARAPPRRRHRCLPRRRPVLVQGRSTHLASGNVDRSLMTNILAGRLLGVWIGAALLPHVPVTGLRHALGIILAAAALGVLTKAGVSLQAVVFV